MLLSSLLSSRLTLFAIDISAAMMRLMPRLRFHIAFAMPIWQQYVFDEAYFAITFHMFRFAIMPSHAMPPMSRTCAMLRACARFTLDVITLFTPCRRFISSCRYLLRAADDFMP